MRTQAHSGVAAALGLLLCLASSLSLSAAPDVPAPEPLVSIPAGVNLEQALAPLQKATGYAVLSEIPDVPGKLQEALRAAPLPEALAEISRSFHVHWMRRGRTLVFLRRYTDSRELSSLEIEEWAAITGDVDRLVNAFAPGAEAYRWDGQLTTDQKAFLERLTGEQLKAMQAGPVPLVSLKPEQQQDWLRINYGHGFGKVAMEGRRYAQMTRVFSRTALAYLTRPTQVAGGAIEQHTRFWFVYPETNKRDAQNGEFMFNLTEDEPQGVFGGVVDAPSGESLPAPAALPRRFAAAVKLPAGAATLTQLLAGAGSAAECQVRCEPYARDRRLLAFVDGTPAGDVMAALGLMWGWELREEKAGRYYFGRSRPRLARTARELITQLRAAFPPTIRLMFSGEGFDRGMRGQRYHTHRLRIMAELNKILGRGWKRADIADMSPALRQYVANWLFDFKMRFHWFEIQGMGLWLSEPERGYFTLSGPLEAGKNPLLHFRVQRPDGGQDGWGWFANTASRN